MDEGFVDLRPSGNGAVGNDSFWPSFTDIMMVIVMIFMIASTLLMLRNWDLVRELRATIAAEHAAEELAASAQATSATLEERLADAQHEISLLRMQLMKANERSDRTEAQLAKSRRELSVLQADGNRLAVSLEEAQSGLQAGRDRLARLEAEYLRLKDADAGRRQQLDEARQALQQLELGSRMQAAELEDVRQQYAEAEEQLTSLQGDYGDLKVKYDKLFKPARSAQGRHVVSVRYWKEGDYYQLRLKESAEGEFRPVTRKQLHQRLSSLKAEHPRNLYVKVIIPEDSGLSYNEAWSFTFKLLEEYDYYHQAEE